MRTYSDTIEASHIEDGSVFVNLHGHHSPAAIRELVTRLTKAAEDAAAALAVGDLVIVTGNGDDESTIGHYLSIGQVAKVTQGRDADGDYLVTAISGSDEGMGQYVDPTHLRKIGVSV